jgi:hypothetical protein
MTDEKNKKTDDETGFELVPESTEPEIKISEPPDCVIKGMCEAYKEIMDMMRAACARNGVDVDNIDAAGMADLSCAIQELESLCSEIMTSATGGGNHIGFVRGVVSTIVLSPVREMVEKMRRIDRDRRAG